MFAIIIGNPSGYMKWKSIDTRVWSSREEDAESITLRLVSISVLLKYIMLNKITLENNSEREDKGFWYQSLR